MHKKTVMYNNLKKIKQNWQLYLLVALPVIYILVFAYYPMYGVQIAFRRYVLTMGITGSPWVGLFHFKRFVNTYMFMRLIRNTLGISLYSLIAGFPFPILLALSLNYMKGNFFKKTVQMTTYAPYFISTVVMVGIIMQLLHPTQGVINIILDRLNIGSINFMSRPDLFMSIYVWSGIWQSAGWSSIIYLAALSGIDQSLYEASIIDGATKLQRVRYIDIPGILPTIVIILILNSGNIMSVGFEKIFLMQNYLNINVSEVISTYVYKVGMGRGSPGAVANFSYAAAIGLLNSVVNFILLVSVNYIARRSGETSLW